MPPSAEISVEQGCSSGDPRQAEAGLRFQRRWGPVVGRDTAATPKTVKGCESMKESAKKASTPRDSVLGTETGHLPHRLPRLTGKAELSAISTGR